MPQLQAALSDALTSPRGLFTLAIVAIHAGVVFGVAAFYGWMFRRGALPAWQLRPGKAPPPETLRAAWLQVIPNHLFMIPVAALFLWPLFEARGMRFESPWPSALTVVWQLLAMALISDTVFYWAHRLLHTPWLYKHIHALHHRFRDSRSIAAGYAHTAENLMNFVATFLPPLLLGVHGLTFFIWWGARLWETADSHSGYTFTPMARRHAYHHLKVSGNYGSFYSLWDVVMGTDRAYREWLK